MAGLLALLMGCLPGGQNTGAPGVTPITTGTVEVTALPPPGAPAAPAVAAETPSPPEPAPEQVTEPAAPAAPPTSPEARACQRMGGVWIRAGTTGLMTCQRQTGEGARACRRASDCAGDCLARSGTCSPVAPLFGCNEVLDDLGRRTTQCVN